ncbi:MAG: SIS domain-containing protein [bacterium]|nr:MAG: SIS domain-containing protein [bacterium]
MKNPEDLIRQRGRECASAIEEFCFAEAARVHQTARSLVKTIQEGGKILVAGNGGSAADAQHFSAELVNRFLMERRPVPCLALTTDTSILTSISNDYSYDQVFSRQVEALGEEGDALIAITTSGSSGNIVRALEKANAQSMLTIGLTGGECAQVVHLCDICLSVAQSSTPRIQEVHHLVLHIIAELVEIMLFSHSNA